MNQDRIDAELNLKIEGRTKERGQRRRRPKRHDTSEVGHISESRFADHTSPPYVEQGQVWLRLICLVSFSIPYCAALVGSTFPRCPDGWSVVVPTRWEAPMQNPFPLVDNGLT